MENALLEIRFFDLHPGTRDEFHRISHEGTVPLMRRCGITVVAYGPMLNDENAWCLVRAFKSEQDRITTSATVYETAEWLSHFDAVVPPMIAGYRTAVLNAPSPTSLEWAELT
ncbi:NIPSNAP family protein [Winogradskya humida]|uniref:NIPSNAP protein n=1 Tax=Winogradskya humida TaxID=113566 RepID=A0ABQ3ZHR9_9ACTN|nr:NIPSNAP family protein [Actinoplanes humidus]GIE17797.1 hypothetical protein Ahu01nite_008990 [Actinoplanes humidus]